MPYVSLALLVLSVLLFVISLVWGLAVRGKTTTRTGADIGAELMTEKMDFESGMEGRPSVRRGAKFWGSGWAGERTAEYSWAEVKQILRQGRIVEALPPLLGIVSVLGVATFGGLSMLLWPAAPLIVVLFGVIFLAAAAYALYLMIRGWLKA